MSLNGTWDFYPAGGSQRFDIQVPSFWDAPQDYGYPQEWLHLRHGVYRRRFLLPDGASDREILLDFRRISVLSQVLVNGHRAGGETTDGYLMMQLPYVLDITPLVKFDSENELEVRVWGGQSLVHGEDQLNLEELDFPADVFADGKLLYPYGVDHYDGRRGINGDVKLRFVPKVRVSDAQIITDLKGNRSSADDEITIRMTVENDTSSEAWITLRCRAVSTAGRRGKDFLSRTLEIPPGSRETVSWESVPWTDASYWWPYDPHLYRVEVELAGAGEVLDRSEYRFGFREFRVVGNHFELNGVPVKLRGDAFEFSWHEGYRHGPATAPVISTRELVPAMQRRLLEEYRQLNMNVLRPHKASGIDLLYDLCDESGMMVMDEAPFWETFQRTDDRARFNYMDWVRRWVTERRNHPSIVMWIIGNECWGSRLPEFTYQAAREVDSTRPVFHEGIRPGDFEGDVESIHYTGGYPMEVFNTTDLYGIYTNNSSKPMGEGEALFADGWPLKAADGSLSGNRTERGEWNNPDRISQAEWVRGVARFLRAMRFAGLSDSRLYADWWYCFEPVEETIRPNWDDPAADGIKPKVLDRPIVNVSDPAFPDVIHGDGYEYWRDSCAPVAVFDLEHDRTGVIGVRRPVFRIGERIDRRIVVYNDELNGGTTVDVNWSIGVLHPRDGVLNPLGSRTETYEVPYGEKMLGRFDFRIPVTEGGGWLILTLSASKNGVRLFEEQNRLGALVNEPDPQLVVEPGEIDLGILNPERARQLRRIKLINVGGGNSLAWTLVRSGGPVVTTATEGNLRGEQEIYFTVDLSGVVPGQTCEQTLHFDAGAGGTSDVTVRFATD